MSLEYVTLAEVKYQLRMAQSETYDDTYLTLLIQSASATVKNYLKDFSPYEAERDSDDDYWVDSSGYREVIGPDSDGRAVKPEVKAAVLILIAEWYKNREGEGAEYVHMVLPAPVLALLYPLRDPALK